jgi:hypothetical protein
MTIPFPAGLEPTEEDLKRHGEAVNKLKIKPLVIKDGFADGGKLETPKVGEWEVDDVIHDLEALDFNSKEARQVVKNAFAKIRQSEREKLLVEKREEIEKLDLAVLVSCLKEEDVIFLRALMIDIIKILK